MSEDPIRARLRRTLRAPPGVTPASGTVEGARSPVSTPSVEKRTPPSAVAQPTSDPSSGPESNSSSAPKQEPESTPAHTRASERSFEAESNSNSESDSESAPKPERVPPGTPEAGEKDQVFARLARRSRGPRADATSPVARDDAGVASTRTLSPAPPRDLVVSSRGTAARTLLYDAGHRHGTQHLHEALSASLATLAERARDERLLSVDLSRALYMDTETTGLSGGAGTYVFLVGLGRFVSDQFELWQGFLPHPADEKKLLEDVAERIAAASVLVSFFGKSFDRHRLEDKMRLHGVTPPFANTIHLDLYHPLRRAHRGQFENCRLKTLERELVGVERPDDLPGSFAPAAWFDFLGRRPHRLEGVFQHNADDVLSLATLLAHLAR